jgi:serine/threonine-protein kinase RsbT
MGDQLLESARVPVKNLINVIAIRRRGLEMALKIGFSRIDATKIAVVVSELARNITLYTDGGIITLIPQTGPRRGIKVIAQDNGPGIEDVERVLTGGYTTSNGLGLGVSGSRRIMDEFEIQTVLGAGTTIRTAKWLD